LRQKFRKTTVIQERLPHAVRLVLTVIALLAFTFQSYVAQTHFHLVGQSVLAAKTATSDAKNTAPNKTGPADPSSCPVCQELLHSGSFVAPNALAALPPALAVSSIAIRLEMAIAPQPVSHSWHGRAPPHI
jgi:hypothetical protein